MLNLLAAAVLATADVAAVPDDAGPPSPRLLASRAEVLFGTATTGFTWNGGRWGDVPLLPGVAGRFVRDGLALDGSLVAIAPAVADGISAGANATLRAGYVGHRWAIFAGAFANWALEGQPAWQWMPSLRGELAFERFGISAGVFDHGGFAPLHVTAEVPTSVGHLSVGYLAPLGAVVGFSRPLSGQLSARAQLLYARILNTEQATFTVGLAWGGAR